MNIQQELQSRLDQYRSWLAVAQRKRQEMELECDSLLTHINDVKRLAHHEKVNVR